MSTPIPATIITGFLGAGKTTLIQNLIRKSGGKRIALVVNEFGDLGFDGEQIAGCGIEGCNEDDVIELTNGCICCTVADDFLPTMETLLARDPAPEHIVIETSGLALPQPLVQAFNWPSVATRTTVDGVVTVADAEALAHGLYAPDPAKVEAQRAADESLDHETPVDELFADQMRCADLVVLSKTDRLADGDMDKVARSLAAKRSGVEVVHSTVDGLSAELLIGLDANAEQDMVGREAGHHHHDHGDNNDHGHDHHHDHSHDDFDSQVITPPLFTSKAELDAYIAEICSKPGVLRVKGVVQIADKAAPVVVQAVGPRVTSHFDTSGRPQTLGLVVIGTSPLVDLSDLESAAA